MKPPILIIGLGRSGVGAAKLLKALGHEVIVLDSSKNDELLSKAVELRKQGIKVHLGTPLKSESFEPWIENLSEVVISPSIPWDHQALQELRLQKILIKGEISLAWEKLKHLPWVGITGTNGKTTVTYMLQHVLQSNQLHAPIGGNVGKAATEIALNYHNQKINPDWLIMELSSYQLETTPEITPKIAIWTNLTPDHLERHGTIEKYSNIKERLLINAEIPIYNADDPFLISQRDSLKKGIWISAEAKNHYSESLDYWINNKGIIMEQQKELFHSSCLTIPGKHNLQNLLFVIAASRKIGLSGSAIGNCLKAFKGVPHRLEKLGMIDKITIFNDSKATNYESAKLGLIAIPYPAIIIAGGIAKKGDPSEWLIELKRRSRGIVLFGNCALYLEKIIKSSGYKGAIHCCTTLPEALEIALAITLQLRTKSLLFSPACASFDQYKDFEARGDHFCSLIKPLLTNQSESC